MVILSEASSSSSSTHDHRYDVFLSFRGIDTRLNFIDHLHNALIDANLTTFLGDEEIEAGEDLKPELESAIKASRASIIVLSKNYASSRWCLDELVLILDQHRICDQFVIPIFYHVEPAHIRKQENSFGVAMTKHKHRIEKETNEGEKMKLAQKMEVWKEALAKIAEFKGTKDARDRQESKFIEEIVTEVCHRLGVSSRSNIPLLYGMENSIEFITSWLKDGYLHNADILTILGMGGIGKTSLAKYIYRLHHHLFDRSSFIEGVDQICVEQVSGLLGLQKQLCGDISKTSPVEIHDVFKYTSMIENALARQKVFIVLDDVGSLLQLNALLGNKGYHPGSKIIITTKDMSLIEKYVPVDLNVRPKHTKLFLQGLHDKASLQLLSYHAFHGNSPKEGYEKVSEKLVEYCKGHPLALEVFGKSLRNQDVAKWECITRLKEETTSGIQKALQMSFYSMPSNNDKELFKHIACFFVGEDKGAIEMVLEACGLDTLHGFQNLIDRCLLMIGPKNELQMHQLIQEMGREVVRQESPHKPWKRSRLWCHEESFNVLQQNRGTGKLEGLVLDMEMLEKEKLCGSVELKTEALSKMENLKLLQLNYVPLDGSYKNFPQKLRWLCMHGFPLKSIPSDLQMANLVVLNLSDSCLESFDMSNSNTQGPKKRQKLPGSSSKDKRLLTSLKILNLRSSKQLHSLGGFCELPALERLILANCISLTEVCESIEQCDELVFVDLSYCNMLKKLPKGVVKLKKVETLLLDGCDLGEFPIEMKDIDLPEMLKANNIGINPQTFSSTIVEAIPRDFRSCAVSSLNSLVCLSLKDMHLSNETFSMDFGHLSMLKELHLDGNPIVTLPNSIKTLRRLQILSMQRCHMLKTFEHPPRTLKHLILGTLYSIQKVVFDREMSPLTLSMDSYPGFLIEGIIKIEAMVDVAEEVLRSLSWTNLECIKNQHVVIYYEFGIFSTIYKGIEIPNWISHRNNGSSISFTMPSSPNNLRGFNFCYVVFTDNYFYLPSIKIDNITKNHTWIYDHCSYSVTSAVKPVVECVIFLSHWMFGKNEMEDGDQVTISTKAPPTQPSPWECGVSVVYEDEDGKMEEDPLAYYKSWNHIIGGDLSAFQTITGEYVLGIKHFFGLRGNYCPFTEGVPCYVEKHPQFRAFSQNKSNVVGDAPKVFHGLLT